MNYDDFHSQIKVQKRIIDTKNFTYRNTLEMINSLPVLKIRSVLDYGCGVGTVDFYLSKKFNLNVLGLEVSQKAINICRKSAEAIGIETKCRFSNINCHINKKFDLIICSEVIEHVKDDDRLLTKLSKLLNRNGYIFISTPSINAPLYKHGLLGDFDRSVGHLRRYEPNEIVNKLKAHNLRIVRFVKTEGVLRNALYVFPKLSWIVRFVRGPFSDLITYFDEFLVKMFGESNLLILAQKI